jgi:hypothetical protein
MHRTSPLIGVVVMAVGAVFVGQGLGLIRNRSFMVGDPVWAVIGVVLIVGGAAVIWRGRRV